MVPILRRVGPISEIGFCLFDWIPPTQHKFYFIPLNNTRSGDPGIITQELVCHPNQKLDFASMSNSMSNFHN